MTMKHIPPANNSKGFLQPILLLLLSQEQSHGYELMEKLQKKGYLESTPDPGVVYRILRKFEKEKMVRSRWAMNEGGPSKRIYILTDKGKKDLHHWAVCIKDKISKLSQFVNEYQAYRAQNKKKG